MYPAEIVIVVASATEWRVVLDHYHAVPEAYAPYEYFTRDITTDSGSRPAVFVHSGCGKAPAAAATQYGIDTWQPCVVVSVGTCGAIDPALKVKDTVLATKTVVYDLCERSGGQDEMISQFTTELDLDWITPPYPSPEVPGTVVTGDQDVDPARAEWLHKEYGAVAGDWESGAIAYVAQNLNGRRCLILRTVSDVVTGDGSDIYAGADTFTQRVATVLPPLLDDIPAWLIGRG